MAALVLAGWLACPVAAEQTYVVRPGDTLGTIALRFYGEKSMWQLLHRANTERMGPDASALEVGTTLRIPDPVAVPTEPQAAGQPSAATGAAGVPLAVRLVARTDMGATIGPDLPEGGALAAVAEAAFRRAGYHPSLEFSDQEFVPGSTPSAAFPYLRDAADDAAFIVSAAVGTLGLTPYCRRGSGVIVRDLADLRDRRVCASGPVLAGLPKATGSGPLLFNQVAGTTLSCLQALVEQTVDVVLLDPAGGPLQIRELGIQDEVESYGGSIELGSLHALIPKYTSYGTTMAYKLNEALRQMQESGEIESIMARHALPSEQPILPTAMPGHTPTL